MNSTLRRTLIRLWTAVVLKMQMAGNTYCEQQPCKRELSNLPDWHVKCCFCLYCCQWTESLFKHHGGCSRLGGWVQVANNTAGWDTHTHTRSGRSRLCCCYSWEHWCSSWSPQRRFVRLTAGQWTWELRLTQDVRDTTHWAKIRLKHV